MKIVIIGGHLAPSLAVIEALPKGTEILFIGREHVFEGDKSLSLEHQKITGLGITFKSLNTGRFQRKFTRHTLLSLLKLPLGLIQARKILLEFKPDVVLGFGGYLQIPVAYAAYTQKIPIIIHEQTLNAGLSNKIVGKYASKICISWEESRKYFPKEKTILTGNPLRKEFFEAFKVPASKKVHDKSYPILYITGGSAGSHAINLLVEGCLNKLLNKFSITHQTGDSRQFQDFNRLENMKKQLSREFQQRYNPVKFIDPRDVAKVLSSADIVVSRSGMNTICELLYLGKPCLLIPLPYGQTNEQLTNAMLVQKAGIGVVVKQEELTPDIFYSQVTAILAKLDEYENNFQKAKKFIRENAAEKIIEIVLSESKNKQKNA